MTLTRLLRPVALAVALLAAAPLSSAVRAADPVVRTTDAEAVAFGTATSAVGAAYTFSATYSGAPVRYNPCQVVHWRFRTAGAPTSGLTVVKQSIAAIAKATGITFVYDGTSTATPTKGWLPTTATTRPMLIGWTTPAASDLLRGQLREVLAVTQNAWVPKSGSGRILASVVALDATDRLPITGPKSWRTVVLHELGHAMGLGHARSSASLMNAQLSTTLASLAYNDLVGLAQVGRQAGCL